MMHYLVGAPRSGTTFLQELLALHPAIASPPETTVYNYLGDLYATWDRQAEKFERVRDSLREGGDPTRRLHGLPTVVDRSVLDDLARSLLATVESAVLGAKPGATHVLEKTPDHARHLDLVHRLEPDARVVHLVRDPRAVVDSLNRISATWGADWAPRTVKAGCGTWRKNVEAVRDHHSTHRCVHDLRYEDLVSDTRAILTGVFEHLGVDHDGSVVDDVLARHEQLRRGEAPTPFVVPALPDIVDAYTEPEGFRRADPSQLSRQLSDADLMTIEGRLHDLMAVYGYELRFDPAEVRRFQRPTLPQRLVRRTRSLAGRVRRQVMARLAP